MTTRKRFWLYTALYAFIVAMCLASLIHEDDLSLGRQPLRNLGKSLAEMSYPSFLDIWFGDPKLEYRSDDGRVLRVEDRREVETRYLSTLGGALFTTIKIATLGSLLAVLLGLPLGVLAARNLHVPRPLSLFAKGVLDFCRAIHSLVFGLFFVGVIGLGPTAGILAIAIHSMGSYGKLAAEAIESTDMRPAEAIQAVGASRFAVFWFAVWPAVLPQLVSAKLYIWEFNVRDSTILGLVGAGGIGLLIAESMALFQWSRLSTLILVTVAMVAFFDAASRKVRKDLL